MDPHIAAETVEWMWAMKPPSYKEAQADYYKHNPGLPQYEDALKLKCEWTPSSPLHYQEVMDIGKQKFVKPLWDRRNLPPTGPETIDPKLYDQSVTHNMTNEELANFDIVADFAKYCAAIVPVKE
jgi:hypothetical protein